MRRAPGAVRFRKRAKAPTSNREDGRVTISDEGARMIENTWKLIGEAVDGRRAMDNALKINEHARWCHFEAMQRTAEEAARLMEEAGLEEVELLDTPADGVSSQSGWVTPQAVAIEDATLEIVQPRVSNRVLARYRKDPCSLMVYARPTDPEGVTAELVAVPDADNLDAYKGRNVRGKIVLIDGGGITYGESAFDSGAIGIVSDAVGTDEFIRPPEVMKHTRRWHNYTIPPWKTDLKSKGFGFSITPAQGRRLRQLLDKHGKVVLRAIVKGRYFDGKLNVVTGLLPGQTNDQIALTGHLYEWGADDNASGCGLAIEIARAVRELTASGKIERPRRGLRLVFGMEIRGTNVYQARHPSVRRLVAGINMHMIGCEQIQSRVLCSIGDILPANPCYAIPLVLHLAERLRRDYPYFRYERSSEPMLDDNGFCEPMFGAPCPVVYQCPAPHHHSSLDVPEILSPRMFSLMGTMLGTYALFLARAETREARWLAELTYESARQDILTECRKQSLGEPPASADELAERFAFMGDVARRQVKSVLRLVPRPVDLTRDDGLRFPPEQIDATTGLAGEVALEERVCDLGERLHDFAHAQGRDLQSRLRPPAQLIKVNASLAGTARRAAFRKEFPGYLGWEFMPKPERKKVLARLGIGSMTWCSPGWTQSALFWSDGKRSAYDVWRNLRMEGHDVSLTQLMLLLRTLAEYGYVRKVPVVTATKLAGTLRSVGVKAGSVIFVHASLSRFGYFRGGADAMIDGLLDVIGERGTLVMPTFSFCFAGHVPFDRLHTPSKVGVVTEAFRRRADVIRSNHPTHSVGALGPAAREICRDHTYRKPAFGEHGPFGRLLALDARIVMLAPPLSATMMHMGEAGAGLPWRDYAVGIIRDGRVERVMARQLPWHSRREGAFDLLEGRGRLKRMKLGLEDVLVMRARHAVEAATKIFQADPLLATTPDCDCIHCRGVREYVDHE